MNSKNKKYSNNLPLNQKKHQTKEGYETEEKLSQLVTQNEKLQEENTKFQIRILNLEKELNKHIDKTYVRSNDIGHNFFLPSEIMSIWQSIAAENIGDCFMELFELPLITFHLVQEMFFILSKMIKQKITLILNDFLKSISIINIGDGNYEKIKESLFVTLRPFLQENFEEFFVKNNKFDQAFVENYLRFYTQEILSIFGNTNNFDIKELVKNTCFKKMIDNVKKIILCVELNYQTLNFRIEDFNSRELKFENPEIKEKEILNVNGKSSKGQQKIILISPPQMMNGLPYLSLKNIDLPCNSELVFQNPCSTNSKNFSCTPGVSIRSSSYQNLYYYPIGKDDETCKSQGDFDLDVGFTKEERASVDYENITPINTDMNQVEQKFRTERLGKLIHKSEHIEFSSLLDKSHTRSLSKNSTIGECLSNYSSNTQKSNNHNIRKKLNKHLTSNKKAKIYKIRKQGKYVHLEELKPNALVEIKKEMSKNNSNNSTSNNISNRKSYIRRSEDTTSYRNNTNSNIEPTNTHKPMIYLKTNASNIITKYTETLQARRLCWNHTQPFKGTLLKKKKSINTSTSNTKRVNGTGKNSSLEKNIIEYKTNAVTKVNVDNLLSLKDKKQFMDFRKTFIQPNYNFDNINL